MQIEQWLRVWCPHCSRVNWVNNGDPEDIMGFDSEGFQCWKCKEHVPFDDYLYPFDDDDGEPVVEYELGLKSPTKE